MRICGSIVYDMLINVICQKLAKVSGGRIQESASPRLRELFVLKTSTA